MKVGEFQRGTGGKTLTVLFSEILLISNRLWIGRMRSESNRSNQSFHEKNKKNFFANRNVDDSLERVVEENTEGRGMTKHRAME